MRGHLKLDADFLTLNRAEGVFEIGGQLLAAAHGHFLSDEELCLLVIQRHNMRRRQQVGLGVRGNRVDNRAKDRILTDIHRKTTKAACCAQDRRRRSFLQAVTQRAVRRGRGRIAIHRRRGARQFFGANCARNRQDIG